MPTGTEPFSALQHVEVLGTRMAYVDEGDGPAIVFQHGNPTSSYLWRNVMPHCRGLGRRLVACDLVGMGGSGKLPNSGPDRYSYAEQRDRLFRLWDRLALGDRIVLVLHDWGSVLGFDWASRHPERLAGICYMESIVTPFTSEEFARPAREPLRRLRSEAGDRLVLEQNFFVEQILPQHVLRTLAPEEMDAYRAPFARPGEDRRPTLSWPRLLPVDDEPKDVVEAVGRYGRAMAESRLPKLFIDGDPGSVLTGRARDFCRTWPNQQETTVRGRHFLQEDSPDEIGTAIAAFVRKLDGDATSDERHLAPEARQGAPRMATPADRPDASRDLHPGTSSSSAQDPRDGAIDPEP